MKTYNIYRYAYEDEVNQITVPDDVKFHLINSFDNWKETKYGKVCQNKYLAVIPYRIQSLNVLENTENQSINMDWYDISKKYIVIILNDVYPLSEDFPLEEGLPKLNVSYIKVRAIKQHNEYTNRNSDKLKDLSKMKPLEVKDLLCPVIQYIKIHGIDKDDPNKFDVTIVHVGNWIDDRNVSKIERESIDIEKILMSSTFEKVEGSSKKEFEKSFGEEIRNLL